MALLPSQSTSGAEAAPFPLLALPEHLFVGIAAALDDLERRKTLR